MIDKVEENGRNGSPLHFKFNCSNHQTNGCIFVLCSDLLLPGWSLQSRATLGIFYCLLLFWMFLGMNIIADVFMV